VWLPGAGAVQVAVTTADAPGASDGTTLVLISVLVLNGVSAHTVKSVGVEVTTPWLITWPERLTEPSGICSALTPVELMARSGPITNGYCAVLFCVLTSAKSA
jgi:hypothetical protein